MDFRNLALHFTACCKCITLFTKSLHKYLNFFLVISKELLSYSGYPKPVEKKNECLFIFLNCFGLNIFLHHTVTESQIYIEGRG